MKRFEKRGLPYRHAVASRSDATMGFLIQTPDGGRFWAEGPADCPVSEIIKATEHARRAFCVRRLRARGLL